MAIDLIAAGYDNVTAANPGEFVSLPAGGYVCTIINAEFSKTQSGAPMLMLFLDIAEGDFKRFFNDATTRRKKFNPNKRWDNGGIYRQMIFSKDSDKVSPFLKGLLTLILRNNPSCKINFNKFEPEFLIGNQIGFIFAEEEYDFNGYTGVHVVPKFPKDIADIRNGNFTIPELKTAQKKSPSNAKNDIIGSEIVSGDDSPF